jgi:hypothetical protein
MMTTAALVNQAHAAEWFEVPGNRLVSEILPSEAIKGPHHRIRDKVVSYGYLHTYTVDSDFGTFEVMGDSALRKLLKEIRAISILRKIKGSEAVVESLKHAGKAPLTFGKNIVTEPVDTVTGIPRGIASLVENIGQSISTTVAGTNDPSEDARIKQIIQVSSWKRNFAKRLNVDVYSSNKVLQKELNSLAWPAAITGLSVSAVTMPADSTFVIVMKNVRLLNQIGGVLYEEPPARVTIINHERLVAMGVNKELAQKFLEHPSYTPRHDTVIVECLRALGNAKGREEFIKLALDGDHEISANYFQQLAEILRGYHLQVSPIKRVYVIEGFVFADATDGSVVVPFAADHGVWSAVANKLIGRMVAGYRATGSTKRVNFWVSGTLSALAATQLAGKGIDAVFNVDERIGFVD